MTCVYTGMYSEVHSIQYVMLRSIFSRLLTLCVGCKFLSRDDSIKETEVCMWCLYWRRKNECRVEPASRVWSVGHVDSAHLITGPCVCIVKLDNGPAAAEM